MIIKPDKPNKKEINSAVQAHLATAIKSIEQALNTKNKRGALDVELVYELYQLRDSLDMLLVKVNRYRNNLQD